MIYFKDKIVWVTGASSGIGEALVKKLAEYGAKVILSARRETELLRVKEACGENGDQCILVPLDLENEKSINDAIHKVKTLIGTVDIMINNGGISQRSLAEETSMEVDRRLMEINYFGAIALTKAVLPGMLKIGRGNIVAVSSVAGKFGFPLRSAYSASKHAIQGYYETLGLEVKDKGVHVTIACPGRVRTEISKHALTKDGEAYDNMDLGINEGISPNKCAKKMLRAIANERSEILIGGKELLMVYIKRFIPALFRKIAKNISPT
ncbi:MAG: dehydrogenase/reductase SDR family protein 7B [Flavobacteriales bacterium]